MNKKATILTIILAIGLFIGTKINTLPSLAATTTTQQKTVATQQKAPVQVVKATPLEIVNTPAKYLNKTVEMQATFDKFSTLGLDYSKAMRSSEDYIGILIQRTDVLDHNIPLSEMKMFLNKNQAEKYIDLSTGDKIQIKAKVFSTALNDPWLDIEKITVLKKNTTDDTAKK